MFDPQMMDTFFQIVQALRPVSANARPAARPPASPVALPLETGA